MSRVDHTLNRPQLFRNGQVSCLESILAPLNTQFVVLFNSTKKRRQTPSLTRQQREFVIIAFHAIAITDTGDIITSGKTNMLKVLAEPNRTWNKNGCLFSILLEGTHWSSSNFTKVENPEKKGRFS
jgi:hypothetical protein